MALDLEYGRRIYDRWGRHPRVYWAGDWPIFLGRRREIRKRAVDALALQCGDAVLEVACGPGVNFELIEKRIGPSGRVTAVDHSEEMLASARACAGAEGWHNIEFVHADAAHVELPADSFDAALCVLGLSVMPDHRGAMAQVRNALKAGGRFVVLDARLPRGPARVFNPALKLLIKYVSNADADRDLLRDLGEAMDEVSVDEFNAGTLFIATAYKTAGQPTVQA
ncbi:MAG: class I SAM-dependent methyltransferase [Acidimicrobiales bacterium]